MKVVCQWFLIFLLMCFLSLSFWNEASCEQEMMVRINKGDLLQGDLLIIEVLSSKGPPQGSFSSSPLTFREDQGKWIALFGISYWLEPGDYYLKIKGVDDQQLQVHQGQFHESRLVVSKGQEQLVTPLPEDEAIAKRKEEDRILIREAYRVTADEIMWCGPFIWPCEGRITTGFGDIRYVNDRFSGQHSGIDIAAPEGTPIVAANYGQVRLAQDLLVTGLTVIIDHGFGIYSSYSHLSQLKVHQHQRVEKGQLIGLMGSTGFSTGSHLHWVIRTQETYLNPEQFLSVDIRRMIDQKEGDPLFLVRVGSFHGIEGARALREELASLGYEAFIVQQETYSIQVGAFSYQINAERLVEELIHKGYQALIHRGDR